MPHLGRHARASFLEQRPLHLDRLFAAFAFDVRQFAVEVVRAGGRRELVGVTVGLLDSAGGRVQVEGDIREGDQVVVPSL